MPELRDSHRCRCVPESVFRNDPILRLAENEANAWLVIRMAKHVIDGGEVEVHLAGVLRLERRHLEIDDHEASKLEVVEKQIELEVLSAENQGGYLATEKSESYAELDKK